MVDIRQSSEGNSVYTEGLKPLAGCDLIASHDDPERLDEAHDLLEYVIHYLTTTRRSLLHGESMSYGYWLLRFLNSKERKGHLQAWELTPDASIWQPSVSVATRYWREQHVVCERLSVEFSPPLADRLVSIAPGVLQGAPLVGGRYPA